MEDFLDFRLSPKMHIKLNVFMGFLSKYIAMCIIVPVSIFFKVDLSYKDKKNYVDISNKRKGARAKNQDP